jgi:glutamate synthase (NADPH/NADH) small chain
VGHAVTLFERADRMGGLMRYGIPEFKMEKRVLDRRLAQMKAEGVSFKAGVEVGKDLAAASLLNDFDAVVLAGGSTVARDLPVPGRELKGVHFAMEFLKQANQAQQGDKVAGQILAKGLDVVVVGGGDTGADCIGTAIRQGAKSVVNLELMPQPPEKRAADNPWPQWARVFRTAGAHEEGVERIYSIQVKGFEGEGGRVKSLKAVKLDWSTGKPREVAGSEFTLPAGLVTLAMGFTGPEKGLLASLGVELDGRGNAKAGADKATSVKGVFTAGDMTRGQSLIVWAIREGRQAAHHADKYLMGETSLPC